MVEVGTSLRRAAVDGRAVVAVARILPSGGGDGEPRVAGIEAAGWAYPLTAEPATIGRGLDNTIVLADALASRYHARIVRRPAGWEIANLSQRQPLWMDGAELACGRSCPLPAGAVLRIGETRIQFLAPATSSQQVASERAEGLSGYPTTGGLLQPGITFQFAMSGRAGQPWWRLALLGLVALVGVSVVLTALTLLSVGRQAWDDGGLGHALTAAGVALLPALASALVVYFADQYEREPWTLLGAGFIWGGVVAIPLALLAERLAVNALPALSSFGQPRVAELARGLAQALIAGGAEEVVKGAGLILLLLALRDQFDNATDGILYGVVVGAGFAVVENFSYLALSPSGELPWLFVGRILLGWLGHSTFTALFGAGLGLAREAHRRSAYLRAPVVAFLAALFFHSLFDAALVAGQSISEAGFLPLFARAVGFLAAYGSLFVAEAVLLRLLLRSLAREAAVIRDELADEVVAGWVTPAEYAAVQDPTHRGHIERRELRERGVRAYATARALHQAIIGLAVRKWHVARGDAPKATAEQPEAAYRRRIAHRRATLLSLRAL